MDDGDFGLALLWLPLTVVVLAIAAVCLAVFYLCKVLVFVFHLVFDPLIDRALERLEYVDTKSSIKQDFDDAERRFNALGR